MTAGACRHGIPTADPDAAACAFYEDPEHLRVAGPGRKRERPRLTEHVPVRFPPELIDAVKVIAAEDGRTVSSWIRHLVSSEVRRKAQGQAGAGC